MIELGPDDGESVNGASARRQNEFRQDNSGRFDPIAPFSTHGPSVSGRSPMTTDAITQLAILADALTEIVDLTTADEKALAPPEKCWRGQGTSPPKRWRRPRLTGACRRWRRPARRGTRRRIPGRRRRRDGALRVH